MSRSVVLAFTCLACFLVLLPLAPKKPGLPMQLFGEEATWFLMASSLARDGDLRLEQSEVHQLFDQFPFTPDARLELASADGWQTTTYARPVPYPLFAAPFAALFGANGLIFLNAVLLMLAIALATAHLRRWNGEGSALLFSAGFFILSAAGAHMFRMQPQIFVLATVTACLYFSGLGNREPSSDGWRWSWVSGAALALAIPHDPGLVLLAVPAWIGLAGLGWRAAWTWLAGCVGTLAAIVLLSHAWTGSAFPDREPDGVEIASFVLESPLETPWLSLDTSVARPTVAGPTEPAAGAEAVAETDDEASARRSVGDLLEDFGFLLWGRRSGLFPYFPGLIPILVVFALYHRRSRRGWALLATALGLGLLQLFLEPAAAHAGEIGNPHAFGVVPIFLFLATRLPTAAIVAGYALGALVASTLLLTPYGSAVPGAPIHAHTRNFPFDLLPFEYPALGRAPGFIDVQLHGIDPETRARLWAPADQAELLGTDLWTRGGESAELWLESRAELPVLVFLLRNLASNNDVRVRLGDEPESRSFEQVPPEGVSWRAELDPARPTRIRHDANGPIYYYRLRVDTRLGEKPKWRLDSSGNDYLGLGLLLLGTQEYMARDLYAVEWAGCGAPPSVVAGEEFLAAVRLRNSSGHPWPHLGTARVRLSYRWLDEAGGEIPANSLRTELGSTVEPGQKVVSWLDVQAPREPGRYLLEIDPVFESVAWFSKRNGGVTCRTAIEVTP